MDIGNADVKVVASNGAILDQELETDDQLRMRQALFCEYPQPEINGFDVNLVREFLLALSLNAKLNLHSSIRYGLNSHHMVEALFKATGCALSSAFVSESWEMSTK